MIYLYATCWLLPWLQIAIICIFTSVAMATQSDCPRHESKMVRRLIHKAILPVYDEHTAVIPHQCPLAPPRDIYGYQEDMKYEEGATKWVCQICGKSFYEERFLDRHFDNRHPNSIRQGPVVCLSNYCDVFRCEVISQAQSGVSSYWDHALCKESDLERLHNACIDLIKQCVPNTSSAETQKKIFEHLNMTLCAYLTCDNYWELPTTEMSAVSLVYYIVAGMILVMGLFTYFMLLHSQLLQRPNLFIDANEAKPRNANYPYAPENQEIRHRQTVAAS